MAEYVKKPKNYLNNKDLLAQIVLSKEAGKMSDELAKMTMMLVDKYAKHPQFANIYSYKEDMISFTYLTLFRQWHNFDPAKSDNPFAYFTQIAKHAFFQYVNMEKKQRLIKDARAMDLGVSNQDFEDSGFHEDEVFGKSPVADKDDTPIFDA